MTENAVSTLVVAITFTTAYYFLVLRTLTNGEYSSKHKFLFDLIPFGAVLRLIWNTPRLIRELIQDVMEQYRGM